MLIGGIVLLAVTVAYGAVRTALLAHSVAAELDRAAAVAEIVPRPQSTIVFDHAGRPAFSFFSEQRIDVPLDHVSPHMVDALLSVEDKRFYSHHGLDLVRIAGAAWRNVSAGRIREGGSTLTQQLARASHLNSVRTFDRKLREAVLAAQLEHRYSKAEILEAYLNAVYFGEGYYGVEAASRG
jgi:membrane peptidoglycan carboxypeptidase